MALLRVTNLSMSLDGYVAGPNQSLAEPLGRGGEALHEWIIATRTWRQSQGLDGGEGGFDDDIVQESDGGFGATIMGRNMFGPVRGPWDGAVWKGWWGDDPPFHHPVFVLTHHPHPSITMQGGTEFHFVTGGIHDALERADDVAAGQDIRLGGGAATIRQCLRAGLVDELSLAVVPTLLGDGERPFNEADAPPDLVCARLTSSTVAHVRMIRPPHPEMPSTGG
jgi:dihydrofolate reductase